MFAIVQGTARRVRLNVTNSLGYFLIKFTNQYNLDEVYAVFQNLGSTLKPIILITDSGGYGTPNPLDGEVNLNVIGNWEAKIYSQSSASNLNVDLATNLLSTTTVFVQGDTTCVTAPRNADIVKTCQDVSNCIGISSEGSSVKYLNEQGDFVTIDSIDDIAGLIEAGSNITITGSGTLADPFVISSADNGTSLTDTITAGENLVENDLVYLKSDGKYWKADYLTVATCSTELRLVTDATITANASGESLTIGLKSGFTGLTAGELYYVGASGAICLYSAIPDTEGIIVRSVGTAKSTTELEFNPDETYIETTLSPNGQTGIVRVVTTTSANDTAGNAALTDYVYLVSGTTTIVLPNALSNTNLYTIKRIGVGVVTVSTTSGQTIDQSSTVQLNVQYQSLNFISDGSNWNIV
jgi:hypothetical protein